MSRTVITYGTFDMFHVGHLRLLKRMRELGERVIVAVVHRRVQRAEGQEIVDPLRRAPRNR